MPIPILGALGALGVAGIQAFSGAAQSAADAAQQRYNVDKTNEANRQLAQQAFDRNYQMWLEQNQYNSPQAQMARLKAAGLNPNLVYGQGAVGNASGGIPTYQAPRASYDYMSPKVVGQVPEMLSSFLDMQMRQAQIDNVKAQTQAVQTKTVNDVTRGQIMGHELYRQPELSSIVNTKARSDLNRFEQLDRPGFAYQLEALKRKAELGQLYNDKVLQDIITGQYRNAWMRQGVTPKDNMFLRMLMQPDSHLRGVGKQSAEWIRKFMNVH